MKNARTLAVLWPLPPTRYQYRKKAPEYVASLLGHEGPGSVIQALRVKGWADSLSAYVDYDATTFAVSLARG
eukprot:2942583-Rhodomonas_salina.3